MGHRSRLVTVSLFAMTFGSLLLAGTSATLADSKKDFEITSTYIEACSCDMFCPCYFNTHSTTHVDKGHYNAKLDGAKAWLLNDLGSDWSTGKDSWVVVNVEVQARNV